MGVEKPARYTGGEFGTLCEREKQNNGNTLRTLIAFPDLYEIGMSNQAMRILYNRLNRMENVTCDRAFAPAPDFEELLKARGLPLYGLDTGISLKDTDLLMFTLGYELGFTGVLSMLYISGIPLRCSGRGEDDPLVIMGGPCVSNPLPYSAFIDAFWIGEAEGGFFEPAEELSQLKKAGAKKQDLLGRLLSHPSIWAKGKGRASRAVDADFAKGREGPAVFPVPGMKVVHHHGAVEIMRGCPNGCRFCHAGYWYRPMRQKNAELAEAETRAFIRLGGYREITLSSLSSGDYQYLDSLIDKLNNTYRDQHISFQLPSLKVSGFSLDLLEKISAVRKSGLTYAVETPVDFWQMALNKEVAGRDIVSILKEARRRGWRGAKFYFMIGLPLGGINPGAAGFQTTGGRGSTVEIQSEEEEIAAFIERLAKSSGMNFNINIGTFIPKPHTPFQRVAQLNREEADWKLNYLKGRLKKQGHKVGIQDPLLSVIEGIASRGDERAGDIFEEAFLKGCRLDAWSEFFRRDIWEELLIKHKDTINEFLGEKNDADALPWSCIHPGVSDAFLCSESHKAKEGEITLPCTENCKNPCSACAQAKIVKNNIQYEANSHVVSARNTGITNALRGKADPDTHRILFSFSKHDSAVFHPHLGLMEIFSMAFIRANIPIHYSRGFNPLPSLDIASPLSLGICADGEIATIDTDVFYNAEKFKKELNLYLPKGLRVEESINVLIPSGAKKYSVTALLWGYRYTGNDGNTDLVQAKEEKAYRLSRTGENGTIYDLKRHSVLARNISGDSDNIPYISYFDLYRELYPACKNESSPIIE